MERSFKEVLFRFLEEVHCTKAALYLVTPDGSYALASQYGFGRRDLLSAEHAVDDPIVLKVQELRTSPMAVNSPEDFSQIEDYLRGAGNSRMLLVPLYGASRALGFVDARDKGGQQPFEAVDLRQGSIIVSSLLEVLQRLELYPGLGVEPETRQEPAVRQPQMVTDLPHEPLLDESALLKLNDSVLDAVSQDGVFAVAVTIATVEEAATLVHAAVDEGAVDVEALARHQSEALVHAGVPAPHHSSWRVEMRQLPGAGGNPGSSMIATSVPLHDQDWSLTLSVVSAEGGASPERALKRLCRMAATAHDLATLRFSRRGLARRLLEPGERTFPELFTHSLAVSRLCFQMSQALEMDERSAEDAAIAGLLHDVGMRELDYDRLYLHPSPSVADRRVYRQHVTVGERILSGTGLDRIARAVRHHHERWDGNGYPDQLAGEAIPLLARLVHVAEVYDVLTSASSYRSAVPSSQALVAITTAAGQQFDADCVEVLAQVVG
jgi:hypothetical protein